MLVASSHVVYISTRSAVRPQHSPNAERQILHLGMVHKDCILFIHSCLHYTVLENLYCFVCGGGGGYTNVSCARLEREIRNVIKLRVLSHLQSQGQHMSVDEALLILQRHERARQGRLRAKLMEDIRRQEATAAAEKGKMAAEQSLSIVVAANRIQKMWRGALARRKVRKLREDELTFIGMVRTISNNLY